MKKIIVSDLKTTLRIDLSGQEAWLVAIIESFRNTYAQNENLKLEGFLEFTPSITGEIQVDGQIIFQPLLECSRCLDYIPWKIESEFSLLYKKQPTSVIKERTLSRKELDENYIENDEIILADIVEEQIYLNIPMQTIKKSADGKSCLACHADIGRDLVFGESQAAERKNPFGNLKALVGELDG